MFKKLFLFTLMMAMMQTLQAQKTDFDFEMKTAKINGINLKYYEQGTGSVILYLHGIPSSSYLWRNVVAETSKNTRSIALDLAGYGQSDLPQHHDYSFNNQYRYLKGFIDSLQLHNITLVVNDLGSALGIKYAVENQENIAGLVMIESAFMPAQAWHNQLGLMQRMMFSMFRKFPLMARMMIVRKNKIPEMMLKMGIERQLSTTEKEHYLAPYKTDIERRKVYLTGPGPATFPKKGISAMSGDFADVLDQNAKGLLSFAKPMLLLYATPGMITSKVALEYAQQNFKNCKQVNIGKGKHFLPEDHPTTIANEINQFILKN
jgi:haloalkane dehalogenase